MTYNFVVPEIYRSSTKDLIIAVLAKNWPQTNKQIYHNIKKRVNKPMTFQAVYKSLQELYKDSVLLKDGRLYQLNMDWINSLVEFSKRLQFYQHEKNLDTRHLFFTPNEYVYVLTFNSLREWDSCLFSTEKQFFLKHMDDKKPIIYQTKHDWYPIVYGKGTLRHFHYMNNSGNPFYILIGGDSALDRSNARFYKSLGVNVKVKSMCADNCSTLVYGDTIVNVYLPNKLTKQISSVYHKINDTQELDIPRFIKEVMDAKNEIKVIFYRNKDVAESIRANCISNFSGNLSSNNIQIFEFNNLLDFHNFMNYYKDVNKMSLSKHPWWTLLNLTRRQTKSKATSHLIIGGNSFLDNYIANLYKKQKVKILMNQNYAKLNNIVVLENELIEYFFSKEIRNAIDSLFGKIKDLSQFNLDKYLQLFDKNGVIKVIVYRDSFLVNRIKEKVFKLMNKKSK